MEEGVKIVKFTSTGSEDQQRENGTYSIYTPDSWQSKTFIIEESRLKNVRNIVFNCHLSPCHLSPAW